VNRTPLKHTGKVGLRRANGMKQSAPIVCERVGGRWLGWDAPVRCDGALCELCGQSKDLAMCHIQGRGQQGNEDPANLAVLCPKCHDTLDHADHDTREQLRERLRERNEDHSRIP